MYDDLHVFSYLFVERTWIHPVFPEGKKLSVLIGLGKSVWLPEERLSGRVGHPAIGETDQTCLDALKSEEGRFRVSQSGCGRQCRKLHPKRVPMKDRAEI
jgi:hypothetical protein